MLLVHNLLLLFVIRTTSCLSTTPVDRVAVVNSSTVFECGSNQSVIWSFRRTGQLADKRIRPSDSRYSLNRSTDNWNGLVISNVQLSDSGLYTCIDNDGFGPAASARLVILDSQPTCGANVSVSQPVIESQTIELRCSFIYAGYPPPRVRWTSAASGTVNSSMLSTTQTDSGLTTVRLESWIVVVAAAGGVGRYHCTTTTFDDDDDESGSESTATPMFIWSSSSFVVLYAVRNVVIHASDDEDVALGGMLHCRAEGFPPARYEWRNVRTGRTFIGPDLRLDAEGQHTYECFATNDVENVTHSARGEISLLVTRPSTIDKSGMKFAVSVTAAVVIVAATTAIIAVLVCCVLLLYRLFVIHRQRRRTTLSSSSSSADSAAVVIRHQVRVSPSQDAAAVFHDVKGNGRKPDAVSGMYESIDEQSVCYEELPDGRLSTVQQSAAASPGALRQWLPFPCCDAVDGRDATRRSPRRTPAVNDYLLICGESDGQAECCLQGQSNVSICHVLFQQPPQDDGLYVNDGGQSSPAGSVVGLSDVGVYIHTLSDD